MLKNKYGRHMQCHELFPLLGLKHNKLPKEGFVREVDGVQFVCKPHEPHANGRKSSKHRLFYKCECGKLIPFGRAAQHKKGREHRMLVDDQHVADIKAGRITEGPQLLAALLPRVG